MKNYAKELIKCLNKFDIGALDEFIEKHKCYYSPEFIAQWHKAEPIVKKLTLCKTIVKNTAVSQSTYKIARQWLLQYYMNELEILHEN